MSALYKVFEKGEYPKKKRVYHRNNAGEIILFSSRQKARNFCRNRGHLTLYIEDVNTGKVESYREEDLCLP